MAKALREFAKVNPNLEVKGGLLGDRPLTAADIDKLAQVAPREELLARLAYGLAAPMQQFAGLLQALPRNFAYGLKALIDEQGGVPAAPDRPEVAPEPETATDEALADEAPVADAEVTETEDTATDEAVTETEAPVADAEVTETEDTATDEAVTETEAPADPAEADDTEAAVASDETDAPADEADADDPAAEDAATTEES